MTESIPFDRVTPQQFLDAARKESEWMIAGPAIVVYEDGSYTVGVNGDAKYSTKDPGWLVSIYSTDIEGFAEKAKEAIRSLIDPKTGEEG